MQALRVDFDLIGTPYGRYPDAHVILSSIYTVLPSSKGELLGKFRTSTLLPRVDNDLYIPAPTSWIAKLREASCGENDETQKASEDCEKNGKSVQREIKRAVKLIKTGTVFVRRSFLGASDVDDILAAVKEGVQVKYGPYVVRNALDRLTHGSNMYYETVWYAQREGDSAPVRKFSVLIIVEGDDTQALEYVGALVEDYLPYTPVGANKSHGSVLRIEGMEIEDYPIAFQAPGVLLSLALPFESPPEHPPVVAKKWVIYKGASGVSYREFGVYMAGSVLKPGEYRGGDVWVAKKKCLFVRPLFWRCQNGE